MNPPGLRCACALVAMLAPGVSWAQPASYRIDEARTHADFEVEHLGLFRAHGRFGNVAGTLVYDASAPAGAIDLVIPVTGVASGWDTRDAFLRGSAMFDAARFPRMRFVSKRFEFEGGRLLRVDGDLTLRDVTRPVSLTVHSLSCERETCVADADAAIRRREFSMDAWWPLIGDEVALRLRLVAVRE